MLNRQKRRALTVTKAARWQSQERQSSRVKGLAHMHEHACKRPFPHSEMRFPPDVNETTMQKRVGNQGVYHAADPPYASTAAKRIDKHRPQRQHGVCSLRWNCDAKQRRSSPN